MKFTKPGLPEEDEIIICTVKKILHNSVFVSLDEYTNIEGMLHISEIAPGRIRNIRDYVKPNKKIVCKVLRVDKEHKHIDVSLRRVPLTIKTKKLEEYKQELRAEKLLISIAKQKKIKDPYKELAKPLLDNFDSLTTAFNEILRTGTLEKTKIKPELAEFIIKTVKEKTKLPEVKIDAVVKLTNYEPDGLTKIKQIIKKAKTPKIEFNYISAPNYGLRVKAKDYKQAENILKQTTDDLEKYAKETNTSMQWEKKS